MRIVSSNLSVQAASSASVTVEKHALLQTWHAGRATRTEVTQKDGAVLQQATSVTVQNNAPAAGNSHVGHSVGAGQGNWREDPGAQDALDHLDKNAAIIERFFGHIRRFHIDAVSHSEGPAPTQGAQAPGNQPPPPPAEGMVLTVDTRSVHQEALAVQAAGTVVTQDGRTLAINLDSLQSQSFEVDTHLRVQKGNVPVDPLVLTLPGATAGLDGGSVKVDINGDGKLEDIATLRQGNALVARDLNHDGVIQDGKELLGPSSGNAYGELAALDEDGNGFVDSGDRAFSELMLWRPGEKAQSLASTGVGALALVNASRAYSMKDAAGTTQVQVTSSGVALMEDGRPALLQQVDFVPRG